jgi:hypothetical protein
LAAALETLTNEMQEHRDAWEERSEKWQESDTGIATDGWIDSFETLLDELDGYDEKVDA